MMGASHAATAAVAAAAMLPVMPIDGPAHQLAFVVVAGGMGLLPDLDHHSSTATVMWGPISRALSWVFVLVGRGHRGGTHDVVVAPVVLGVAAWAASLWPWTAAFVVALATGLALRAWHWLIPGNAERTWPINLAVSAAAGWFAAVELGAMAWWLPYAVAVGVLVHIAGDAATEGGVPVPFTWLDGEPRRTDGGPLDTNGAVDRAIAALAPVVCAVLVVQHVPPLHDTVAPVVTATANVAGDLWDVTVDAAMGGGDRHG